MQQAAEIAHKTVVKRLQHRQILSGISWKMKTVSKQIKINEEPDASEDNTIKKNFNFYKRAFKYLGNIYEEM